MRRAITGIALFAFAVACDGFSADNPSAPSDAGATDAPTLSAVNDGGSTSDVEAAEAAVMPRCNPDAEWDAPTAIAELNTPADDSRMRLTSDLKEAYWTSDRDKPGRVSIFNATRENATGTFGDAKRVFPTAASAESDVTVSGDGAQLYFSAMLTTDANLYTSGRDAGTGAFGDGVPMNELNTSANDENQGYVLPDGSAFYFISNRPAQKPGQATHIWVSRRVDNHFGAPVELAELESEFGELSPVVTPDELTIFYSVRLGLGASFTDLWTATRANNVASFSHKKRVDSLSTNGRDAPSYVTPDQCEIFVSYDVSGSFELFHAYRKGTRLP